MRRVLPVMLLASLFAAGVPVTPAAAQAVPGCKVSKQWTIERLGKDHFRLIGAVEVDCDTYQLFADEVEVFTDISQIVATGNVVYTEGTARIAGDRAVFDTKTRTGTFYNAAGSASLGDRVSRDLFGGQEPDLYFRGEEVAKIGPDRYRITRGGFTTCLQPTPRWELTSGSVVIRVDHHAVLRNTVLRVKNVPVVYLPIFYYPIKRDDRATGFLMPTYGTSTLRGFTFSEAFFWAINRSQDATFLVDWFSKTGIGYGTEYRYVLAPGSEGTFRFYRLKEHEATYRSTAGGETVVTTVPARESYQIRGSMAHALPGRLRARGNVDYFSDVTVQQTYQMDWYSATLRQRGYGFNLSGNWGPYQVSGTVNRNETFFGASDSYITGGLPRVTISRSAQRLRGSPLVFGVGGEIVRLVHGYRRGDAPFENQGLTRIDVMPQLRATFSRLQFLPMDASIAFRETWYSQSFSPSGARVDEPIERRYFRMGGSITGPILTRIWDTPRNRYAEKFKHVIEPNFSFERVTLISNDARIIKFDGLDYIVGGTTRMTYGVTTRVLAKRRTGTGESSAREILSGAVYQTYYSDARASQYDYAYSTSFAGRPPSNFSPISIGVRGNPTPRVSAILRMEYDTEIGAFQSLSLNASASAGDWLSASGGWSTRKLPSWSAFFRSDNFVQAGTSLRSPGNRYGGTYNFTYDLGRRTLLQNRIVAYYNAQCCGFAFELQTFNFPTLYGNYPIRQDRRFNFSVTLAGLGTFSNLLGSFGGAAR